MVRMRLILALCVLLNLIPLGTDSAHSATPATITIQVGLARSHDDAFTWGEAEIANVRSAIVAAADLWNRTFLRSKTLKIALNVRSVESEQFSKCDFAGNFRTYLAGNNQRSIQSGTVLLLLNPSSTCAPNGLSKVNGNQVLITRNGLYSKLIDFYRLENREKFFELFTPKLSTLVAHELGHSLGFLHSATLTCPQSKPTNFGYSKLKSCLSNIYGDPNDIMGSGSISCSDSNRAIVPGSVSLANRLTAKLATVKLVSKPGTFTLSQPGTSIKGAFRLSTRYGDAVIELKSENPQLQCTEGVIAARPLGIEIRYLGGNITKLVPNQVGLEGDGASIGVVALNRFPDPDALFLRQDLRFQPGDTIELPGSNWSIAIQEMSDSALAITLSNSQ